MKASSQPAVARSGKMTDQSDAFGARFVSPLVIGTALNPINSSVIATALVAIAAAMGVSAGDTAILVSSLYLTSAIAQPTAGRLAEEFGPRRIFLLGAAIVFVGGLVGGFGQTLVVLVVSRVLIGLGTSAGYPAAMLLISRRAHEVGLAGPPRRVLGVLAVAGAATIAFGPTLGGLLVGAFDWRAAFFVNVPVSIVAVVLGSRWLPRDEKQPGGRSLAPLLRRVDVVGVLAFGGAMTALLVFVLAVPSVNRLALIVAVVLGVALVFWELRSENPFFDVRLLARNGALTRTYVRHALTVLGTYVILYGLTQWIEVSRGLTAFEAGLVLMPMGLLSAVTAQVAARSKAIRPPLLLAAALQVIGALLVLILSSTAPLALIVGVTAIFGLAAGTSTLVNQTALYQAAPPAVIGTASGLLRTAQYVGSIASATITGLVFNSRVDDVGLHRVAVILVVVGLVVLVMTALDRSLARPTGSK